MNLGEIVSELEAQQSVSATLGLLFDVRTQRLRIFCMHHFFSFLDITAIVLSDDSSLIFIFKK